MSQIKKPALQIYNKIDEVPLKYEKRTVTDVCCLVSGLLFTFLLILIAAISFNNHNYYKSNFPSDSDGSLCGIDLPNYQYLYFASLPEINRRVCVTQCPKKGDNKLKCSPTDNVGCALGGKGDFASNFYENEGQQGRGGFFCWPTNQKQSEDLLDRTNLRDRNNVYNSIDVIVLSFYISLVVSIIYFLLVQFFPTKMIYFGTIAGLVMLLAATICFLFYKTNHTAVKAIVCIVMIVVLLFALLSTWKNPNSLRMHSIFLKWSTVVLKDRLLTALYIPFYMLILAMFIGLLIFEFTGFWTGGKIDFDPNQNIYHQLSGVFPTIMTVILVVQMIWGLSFVKQAFNFCVSGNAVLWFYQQKYATAISDTSHPSHNGFLYPLKLMIMKHFGSVVAGAFMNGFLSFYDAIFDFFRPNTVDSKNQNIFAKCCDSFANFFDLVRSDTMAFINLSGNPYCNSARYCQYLCMRSKIMDYAQSTSRVYRLCSHFFLAGIVTIIAMYLKGNISIYALILVFLQSLFISTMFITFHADITDALQIIFLEMQQFYERDNRGTSEYKRQNLHQLQSVKLREPLVKQIAEQRKRENDQLEKARQQQKKKANQ